MQKAVGRQCVKLRKQGSVCYTVLGIGWAGTAPELSAAAQKWSVAAEQVPLATPAGVVHAAAHQRVAG